MSVRGRKTFFEYVIMSLTLKKLVSDIKDNISPLFPFRMDNRSSLEKIAIFSLNYFIKNSLRVIPLFLN
jgi:hypothetical protein